MDATQQDKAQSSGLARQLSWYDAVAVIVGIVIGAGIFGLPGLVALNTPSPTMMMLAWLVGGVLCLCGALTYAELSTTYPDAGGEYGYLLRAYGRPVGFLFVWCRTMVIQTGSIAAAAYIFGEYMTNIISLGDYSTTIYALIAVGILTEINAIGVKIGTWTQNILTSAMVLGLLAIFVAGWLAPQAAQLAPSGNNTFTASAFGLAMIFILFAFGGWNESAYVAGEVRDAKRSMLKILIVSIVLLTILYMLVNFAYLRVLGMDAMRDLSHPVAAATVAKVAGSFANVAVIAVSILVAICALGTVNGCIFTGARAMWSLGNDFPAFRKLAVCHSHFHTPLNAIMLQGIIVVLLILVPVFLKTKSGLELAINYTAPVFWFFMLLIGVGLIILRWKASDLERPFRVPLYPIPVVIFMGMCAYMLYSSLTYIFTWKALGNLNAGEKLGALGGVGILILGIFVYLIWGRSKKQE